MRASPGVAGAAADPHVVLQSVSCGAPGDCAAAGVRSLVVITAGYAEAGDDGRVLQRQLVERVRGYGMRMVGPNCMGVVNTAPRTRLMTIM